MNAWLRTIAAGVALAVAISHAPGAWADDHFPPPRTGGHYDKLMLVRPGIDDFGITLGQWVACVDKSRLSTLPADAPQRDRDIVLRADARHARLTLPGKNNDIRMEFKVQPEYVLLTKSHCRRRDRELAKRTVEHRCQLGVCV